MFLPLTFLVGFLFVCLLVFSPLCTSWQVFQDMGVFLRQKVSSYAVFSSEFAHIRHPRGFLGFGYDFLLTGKNCLIFNI